MNSPGNEIVISSANNTIDRTTLKEIRAKSWPVGTVVFPKVGEALLTEKRRILGVESAFDNNCMGLISGKQIDPMFLLYFMETTSLGRMVQRGVVPSVNQSHVRSIRILLPPLREQRRIVDLIGSVDAYIDELRVRADTARTARSELFNDLMAAGDDREVVELKEVADINCESTKVWLPDKQIQYVDISCVTADKGIDQSEVRTVRLGAAPSRARRVIREGDILVATVRPYLRAFAIVGESLDGQVASTGFAVLRAQPDWCLPEYIWAVVRTDIFVDYLMSQATGSAYPAVSPKAIGAYLLNLPPLAEQQRIVDVLNSVDEVASGCDAVRGRAIDLRTGLLSGLLSGRHEIPASYDRLLRAV